MKTIKLLLFIFESIFVGLVLAFAFLIWQADFDPSQLPGSSQLAEWLQQPDTAVIETAPDPETFSKPPTEQLSPRQQGPFSYADAVASSSKAVVTIYTSKTIEQKVHPLFDDPVFDRLFGEQLKKYKHERTETNLGSGVIMSESGYILTNQHVIDAADEILVSLSDGRSSRAELIGQDRETDIAVLHIDLDGLENMRIANGNDLLRVGDIALAIGNPLNVGQTVTMGIISATGRDHVGLNTFENFIQTDAAINPGNSGGALINARGDLIGINTAIFSQSGGSQGIGFAIPVALAVEVMQEIIASGKVTRGWLGVEGAEVINQVDPNTGKPSFRGVMIVGVFVDSPADKAGVHAGDIIVAINDEPVQKVKNVLRNISSHKPGDKVKLSLLRDGGVIDLSMVTAERPPQ